jgi:hypothetical protein
MEAGFVFLPSQAHWLEDYVHELTTFPSGKYDDQVDSTSHALAWIMASGREPALIQYVREEMEKRAGKAGGLIRLKAPPGISHVFTGSGQRIAVRSDGTIELTEEDARPLVGRGWIRV